MPAMLGADMEAINKFFMETAKVQTPAAENVKQEWMKFWKETERSLTWYTQQEYDDARNLRNRFNVANTTSAAAAATIKAQQASGVTSEEMRGETRRAGTEGSYLEEEKPWIPTSWKVGGLIGVGLIATGVFAKKILALTPYGKFTKYLP